MHLFADGKKIAHGETLSGVTGKLPQRKGYNDIETTICPALGNRPVPEFTPNSAEEAKDIDEIQNALL